MYQEFKVIMKTEYDDYVTEAQLFKNITDSYDNLEMLKIDSLFSAENDEMKGFSKKK